MWSVAGAVWEGEFAEDLDGLFLIDVLDMGVGVADQRASLVKDRVFVDDDAGCVQIVASSRDKELFLAATVGSRVYEEVVCGVVPIDEILLPVLGALREPTVHRIALAHEALNDPVDVALTMETHCWLITIHPRQQDEDKECDTQNHEKHGVER